MVGVLGRDMGEVEDVEDVEEVDTRASTPLAAAARGSHDDDGDAGVGTRSDADAGAGAGAGEVGRGDMDVDAMISLLEQPYVAPDVEGAKQRALREMPSLKVRYDANGTRQVELHDLWGTAPRDLLKYGDGVYAYFSQIRWLMVTAMMLCVIGIPSTVFNAVASGEVLGANGGLYEDVWPSVRWLFQLSSLSLAMMREVITEDEATGQLVSHPYLDSGSSIRKDNLVLVQACMASLALLVAAWLLSVLSRTEANDLKEDRRFGIEDFSVEVRGLPTDVPVTPHEVAEHFKSLGLDVAIVTVYKQRAAAVVGDYEAHKKRAAQYLRDVANGQRLEGRDKKKEAAEKLLETLSGLHEETTVYQQLWDGLDEGGDRCAGYAYVTFRNEVSREICLRGYAWYDGWFTGWFTPQRLLFLSRAVPAGTQIRPEESAARAGESAGGEGGGEGSRPFHIRCAAAPPPTDIVWTNNHVSTGEVRLRSVGTTCTNFLFIMVVLFAIVLGTGYAGRVPVSASEDESASLGKLECEDFWPLQTYCDGDAATFNETKCTEVMASVDSFLGPRGTSAWTSTSATEEWIVQDVFGLEIPKLRYNTTLTGDYCLRAKAGDHVLPSEVGQALVADSIFMGNFNASFNSAGINTSVTPLNTSDQVTQCAAFACYSFYCAYKALPDNHPNSADAVFCMPYWESYALSIFVSMVVAVVAMISNILIRIVTRALVALERNRTTSQMEKSIMTKIVVSNFFNIALLNNLSKMRLDSVPRTIPFLTDDTLVKGGLLFSGNFADMDEEWYVKVLAPAMLAVLTNSLSPALSEVAIAVGTWLSRLLFSGYVRTQQDMDDLYRGSRFALAERYGMMLGTLLAVFCYSPGMPFAFVLLLLYACISYWVDKYVLLRRSITPERTPNVLGESVSYWMGVALLLNILFAYLMYTANFLPRIASPWAALFGVDENVENASGGLGDESILEEVDDLLIKMVNINFTPFVITVAVLLLGGGALFTASVVTMSDGTEAETGAGAAEVLGEEEEEEEEESNNNNKGMQEDNNNKGLEEEEEEHEACSALGVTMKEIKSVLRGLPAFAIASRGRLWSGSGSYHFAHNPLFLDIRPSKPPMAKAAFPVLDDTLDLTRGIRQTVQTVGNKFARAGANKFKRTRSVHVHSAW